MKRTSGAGISATAPSRNGSVSNLPTTRLRRARAPLAAKSHFHDVPIDVVLGGYHLSGKAMETRIETTVRDLNERIRPRVVAPGHCTGWRAKAALAQAFAPERYGPSGVGSMYVLKAAG